MERETDANNEGSARQDNVWKGNRASETSDSLTLISNLGRAVIGS